MKYMVEIFSNKEVWEIQRENITTLDEALELLKACTKDGYNTRLTCEPLWGFFTSRFSLQG